MLSFKFRYLSKPTNQFNFRYGLKSKPLAYNFNYPIGDDFKGSYRFNYDRRDEIFIEDDEVSYVHWGHEVDICLDEVLFLRNIRKIIKYRDFLIENDYLYEVEVRNSLDFLVQLSSKAINIKNSYLLEKPLQECLIKLKDITFEGYDKEVFTKDDSFDLFKSIYEVNIALNDFLIAFLESKSLDIDDDISLFKEKFRLYMENHLLLGFKDRFKEMYKPRDDEFFFTPRFIKEVINDNTSILLFKELLSLNIEKSLYSLVLDLIKELDKENSILLFKEIVKELDIDVFKELQLNLIKELSIKSTLTLSKIINEIEISEDIAFFKVINEIFKHKDLLEDILYLNAVKHLFIYSDLSLEKIISEIGILGKEKDLELNFKDLKVNKSDLDLSIAIRDLQKYIEEYFLDLGYKDVEIEKAVIKLDEIFNYIIDLENKFNKLEVSTLKEILVTDDYKELIKKLVIHDVITGDDAIRLNKSYIGEVLTSKSLGFKEIIKIQDIYIENSNKPVIRAFKEFLIDDDKKIGVEDVTEFEIDIDENKLEEFEKVKSEIEIEEDEKKIEFYKRFWFLRATDPFDFKVLPFDDYPYRDRPIVFDINKELIPENWQLDMIPKLYKEVKEHPIPFGSNLGKEEMALSIEIMIDVINIMILIWTRMYYNFSGYTGSQAVIRFTKILYDWLMLDTSIKAMESKGSKEHYFRVYKWIRWEAEKVALKARDDMNLNGNQYISEWIFELIYYMENHHFDTMPIFDICEYMDEYRALIDGDDPQGDIDFVLDKFKGMRHKIIEGRSKKENE